MTSPVTGADLIEWGHRPDPPLLPCWRANSARAEGSGWSASARCWRPTLCRRRPKPMALRNSGEVPLHVSIRAEDADEQKNVADVLATMAEVLKTPTVEAGAADA